MRIAICDDCMEDALSLKNYLDGQEVSIYSDAESLLADVEGKKRQYDLYLLDIFMEESMNGIELAEKLRRVQEEAMEDINTHVSGSVSRITNINGTIQSMVASSEEIAASAETAREQVDFVHKDIQNIVDIVTRNANDLREIHVSSEELNETAKSSSERIGENVESMSAGFQKEKERADAALRIKELSDTILSISAQTNLLALNASIEAARAGEAGRGFEVVAQEIETLARNTSDAANEIQVMSSDVVEAVEGLDKLAEQMLSLLRNEISRDYESFTDASQSFMGKSDDIRASMEQLQQITERYAESLKSINDVMRSVSAASEETSTEIVHVSEMLLSMDTDMKNIEESTEETFQDILGMNRDLSGYRIDVGGNCGMEESQ